MVRPPQRIHRLTRLKLLLTATPLVGILLVILGFIPMPTQGQFNGKADAESSVALALPACRPGTCPTDVAAGMSALHSLYDPKKGLWRNPSYRRTTGWWNAANALETTIDYAQVTGSAQYRQVIAQTFEKHKKTLFLNQWVYDDQGWWALAWIKAYDLTGEPRYLNMAKAIFADMKKGWDSTCDGGVWWSKKRQYKNAITNELFLAIAVRLHLRTPGDRGPGSYIDWAQREWRWFQRTGMLNQNNLINDGLTSRCQNNGRPTWTYNQGVILGALVDLYKATGDRKWVEQAEAIADATLRHLAPNGILREPCEPKTCEEDGPQFKGIFIRNLAYLYQTTGNPRYKTFILNNASSIWARSRNPANQFGLVWSGPFDQHGGSRQSSAMDALNAALMVQVERQ